MITTDQLHKFLPYMDDKDVELWAGCLTNVLPEGEINTNLRLCHFLAQIATESAGFRMLTESFAYNDPIYLLHKFRTHINSLQDAKNLIARGGEAIANRVYANRYGNGDETSGDGWRYRGHGLMQLTFKDNYKTTGNFIHMDLVNHPELLEEADNAALSAARYWKWKQCNSAADKDDLPAVTILVNGGDNGLVDRLNWLNKAKEVFT